MEVERERLFFLDVTYLRLLNAVQIERPESYPGLLLMMLTRSGACLPPARNDRILGTMIVSDHTRQLSCSR